jgi:hypothetical protein
VGRRTVHRAPMHTTKLIDQFVTHLDPAGAVFRRVECAPWVDALEARLPHRFPASFGSLIRRYTFPSFDAGGLYVFGNTGGDDLDDLSVAIFKDRFIADATLKSGYIQFARPEGGSYDPICFDARQSASNREFPIVRLDHEDILCHDRMRPIATVAASFYRFVVEMVSRG